MNVYVPGDGEAEILLAGAYKRLLDSDDIRLLFVEPLPTLRQFLNLFMPPVALLFDFDAEGIWFLAWIEPSFKGAFFALWIDARMRKSKAGYENMLKAYSAGLSQRQPLLGITGRRELVAEHVKFGYTLLCEIPELYGPGRSGFVVQVDAERINERVRRYRRWSMDDRVFFEQLRIGPLSRSTGRTE